MPSCRCAIRLIAALLGSCGWLAAGGHAQVADAPALRPGAVIERDIEAGASHRYELPLAAGEFADLTITDNFPLRNVAPPEALEVTLRGSSGDAAEFVRRLARETAPTGARRFCVVVDHADVYSLTIAATVPLRYTVRVTDVRPAREVDRVRTRALGEVIEAQRLRVQRTPETDRASIAHYAAAASLWTEAGDRLEAAQAWHRLALVYAVSGDWPKSIDAAERAAALGRELNDRRIEAAAVNSAAVTEIRLGDLPAALRRFERALALFREAGDRDSEAYTLAAIGVIYQSMGDAGRAAEFFPPAIANWRAVGNREGEALGLHGMGTALRIAGRFTEAMPVLEEALQARRTLGHRLFAAATLAQMGHTYLARADLPRGFKAYEDALALQRTFGEWRGEWAGSAPMGVVAQRADWPAGIELFSAGAGIFQAGERAFESRLFDATNRYVISREDARHGIEVLTQVRAWLRLASSGRWSAVVDTAVANLFIILGEPSRALETYPAALATFRAIRDRDGEASALAGLALAEAYLDRLADAREHALAALGVIESFHADVANPEVRELYISRNRAAYALYIEIEMQLERREPGRGHQIAALVASERARARGLLDLLHKARPKITAGVDAQLLGREQQLRADVERADERLTRLLSARPQPDEVKSAERELDERLGELRDVQQQVQIQSPRYASLTQPSPLDLPGIQRLLDDDSVFLEYSLGTVRSYVWVVTRDDVTAVTLAGRAEIEAAARRAHDLLSRGARRDTRLQTRRALESLADLVVAPVAPHLASRRVIVVPDAGLHYAPFAALADGPRGSAKRDPLIARHEVVMLPSASALDALRRADRTSDRPARDLAIFADPVLRSDDTRLPPASARRSASPAGSVDNSASLERLPYSRAEAKAIAALVPADRTLTALDFSASRDTALAELGRARLIHFATHALLDSTHPEQSGIALSHVNRDGAAMDGFLRLHDIYNLRLNADLVVLSACRTALGKELRGEGLIGLTRGFFYAGAPAVVASLWDVRDRSTAELMTRFYRAMLQDNLPPAAALRAAQIAMWRDPRWSSPTHWAGFILQGDWKSPAK